MCGIVGLWNIDAANPRATVEGMLDAMRHRGPDGRGVMEYAGGAAGMVRLALVDLSDRGQQPLWSDDRRVAILFNGEIYNFREERTRLEKQGFRFHTTTDTEVILNLYLERGMDFHERLRGMYAVALFDWRQSAPGGLPVMVLARGPLGIKHLYIAHPNGDPRQVVFSSEIRALLASGLVPVEVNRDGLASYLAHGFVLQNSTMISGVRFLEPGTLERYAPGEPVSRKQFWHFPAYQPRNESLQDAADRLRERLDESVKLHALADAPIGAFLSGGVDSTGIVALMRKHVPDLRTYTIQFPDVPGEDEVQEAVAAAKVYDCKHTVVQVTGKDVAESLPRFAGELDAPSADGLNTWLISRAAARDVKGVLSGVGGDEWFAGYPVTRRMARYDSTLGGRSQALAGEFANWFAPFVPQGHFRDRVENLATRRSALTTWLQGHAVFRNSLARRMVGLPANGISQEQVFAGILCKDNVDWQHESAIGLSCLLDTRVYMMHQLLRDADAVSMAHSLELRLPFVDVEMAEFSRTCADQFKLRADGGPTGHYYGSGSKRVLIHALRDVLPLSISNRQKRGFALPHETWMRRELGPLVEDTCSPETIRNRGLLDPDLIAQVRKGIGPGMSRTMYPTLWTLMVLELWCRAVLDKYKNVSVDSCMAGV